MLKKPLFPSHIIISLRYLPIYNLCISTEIKQQAHYHLCETNVLIILLFLCKTFFQNKKNKYEQCTKLYTTTWANLSFMFKHIICNLKKLMFTTSPEELFINFHLSLVLFSSIYDEIDDYQQENCSQHIYLSSSYWSFKIFVLARVLRT